MTTDKRSARRSSSSNRSTLPAGLVRDKLNNDLLWQNYTVDGRWVCPYCLKDLRAPRTGKSGMVHHIESHLSGRCSSFQNGDGHTHNTEEINDCLLTLHIEDQARSNPAWQVFDHEGFWYSPSSMQKIATVRIVNGRFDGFTVQQMVQHLNNCPHYAEGRIYPVEQVQASRDQGIRVQSLANNLERVVSQAVWQLYSPHGWLCPYCTSEVPRVQGNDLPGNLLLNMAGHLMLECAVYQQDPRAIKNEALLRQRLEELVPSPSGQQTQTPIPAPVQIAPIAAPITAPINKLAAQAQVAQPVQQPPLGRVAPVPADTIATPSGIHIPLEAEDDDDAAHANIFQQAPTAEITITPARQQKNHTTTATTPTISPPITPTVGQEYLRTPSGNIPIAQPMQRTPSGNIPIAQPMQRTPSGSIPIAQPLGRTPSEEVSINPVSPAPFQQMPTQVQIPAQAPVQNQTRTPSSGSIHGNPKREQSSSILPQLQPGSNPFASPTPVTQANRIIDNTFSDTSTTYRANANKANAGVDNNKNTDRQAHVDSASYSKISEEVEGLIDGFDNNVEELPTSNSHDANWVAETTDSYKREQSNSAQVAATTSSLEQANDDVFGWMEDSTETPSKNIQRHETSAENTDLIRAKGVQEGLMNKCPAIPGYTFGTRYEACSTVSGDFYEFVKLDDNRIVFSQGDVSGHGVEAGLIMSMARKTLSIFARQGGTPLEVVSNMNDALVDDLQGKKFITLCYAELNTAERKITWIRAGHNPVMHYNIHTKEFKEIKPGGMVVGMKGGKLFKQLLQEETLPVQSGDIYLVYTDGFNETMNRQGEEYGFERMQHVICDHAERGVEELLDHLMNSIRQFRGTTNADDDLTLLVLAVD